MSEFKPELENYLKILADHGSAGPMVIKGADSIESVLKLNELKNVELPADLITYFLLINGYDYRKERQYEDMPTEIAAGMAAMNLDESYNVVKDLAGFDGDDDTMWPYGFVPILFNYGADYVVVNCIKGSPTYGAVYDLTEGVGVNRMARDLSHFIECSAQELTTGFRVFKHDDEDYEFQSITVKALPTRQKFMATPPTSGGIEGVMNKLLTGCKIINVIHSKIIKQEYPFEITSKSANQTNMSLAIEL